MVAEFAALSLRVDALPLREEGGLWATLLSRTGAFGTWMVVVVSTIGLLSAPRVPSEWRRIQEQRPGLSLSWAALGIHALAFCGFYALTVSVFDRTGPPSVPWGVLLFAWAALGMVVFLSWVAVHLPLSLVLSLALRHRTLLAAGVAAGTFAWIGGQFLRQLWRPLSTITLHTMDPVLALLVDGHQSDPDTLVVSTDRLSIEISEQCSGYEGIGLIWLFLSCYLWIYRQDLRFPRVLWLFPVGTVAMGLANVLRLAGLMALGTHFSPEVAVSGFHSNAGWILFCGVSLGLVAIAHRSRLFLKRPTGPAETGENPTVPYLLPMLSIIAVSFVSGAFGDGETDDGYPFRVLAVLVVLVVFRKSPIPWGLHWSWLGIGAGLAVYCLWVLLHPEPVAADLKSAFAGLSTASATDWSWLVFRVVGTVVTVPIAEELAFRGFLMRRFVSREFESVPFPQALWWPLACSSILFGIVHDDWLAGSLAGAVLGLVVIRTRQLFPAILAHGVANAGLVIHAWLMGAVEG